jgi:hypothetical protein
MEEHTPLENKEFLYMTKFFVAMAGEGQEVRISRVRNRARFGIHTFKLSPPGFGTMRRIPFTAILVAAILVSVLLAAGCTKEVPQTGSLEVTSTPSGLEVQVIVDGNFQGVTPLVLPNLSAGSHLVQIRSTGYAERVQLVTVNAGQRMHIAADYPPIPTPTPVTPTPPPTTGTPPGPTVAPTTFPETPFTQGALYVDSFPAGATIYLDGKGYGVTPRLIPNLTPRSYELRLSLVGWKDYRLVISVSPGQTTREDATLPS